jgi:hypothetical protein
MTYYGGPIISRAEVYQINWNTDVPSEVKTQMPEFYADVLGSSFWSPLSQYSTATQQLGLGLFGGSINFSEACGSCELTFDTILQTVVEKINTNDRSMPRIALDSTGYPEAIFIVQLPAGAILEYQGSRGCVDFDHLFQEVITDAAHGNLRITVGAVAPCHGASQQRIASSLLVDMITDPDSGPPDYALAWADATGSYGVGLTCIVSSNFDDEAPVQVAMNHHYHLVQKYFSNERGQCVAGDSIFGDGEESVIEFEFP